MEAFSEGWPERTEIVIGCPPDNDIPFIVWGQIWTAEEAIPKALATNREFWQIDNGYIDSARGGLDGYYRVTYRGLQPVLLEEPDYSRSRSLVGKLKPWRSKGRHVLFALPGMGYGKSIGLDMKQWWPKKLAELRNVTKRHVHIRDKLTKRPLSLDFRDCWALCTHSSNVAVDAVMAGIPVFVEPSNPAAPVGNLSLDKLEAPDMPEREHWLASLMSQQFTLEEIHSGVAYQLLMRVKGQVEHGCYV